MKDWKKEFRDHFTNGEVVDFNIKASEVEQFIDQEIKRARAIGMEDANEDWITYLNQGVKSEEIGQAIKENIKLLKEDK